MADDKNEVSRNGLNNLDREWRNYQALSQSAQNLQRSEVGILRDAKSGADFNRYVRDELSKAPDRGVCATNIARELSKDPRYLINAATNLEGRRGLYYLSIYIEKSSEGKALSQNIDNAMKKWEKEAINAEIKFEKDNLKGFKDNFPRFEKEIKKQLESRGVEVNRVYYKPFTENQLEIRAEVKNFMKGFTVETMKGEKQRIYTGSSDIRIGGYDPRDGRLLSKETLDRHGTAPSSVVQADDLILILQVVKKAGELLVRQIGKTLTKEAASLGKNLTTDALKVGAKEGGRDSEGVLGRRLTDAGKSGEAYADTVEDLTKTFRRERPPRREGSGEASPGGRDTKQDLGDTLEAAKQEGMLASGGPPSRGGLSATKEPLPYSEMDIKTIGEDAASKANRLGITKQELSEYLDDKVWKAGHIDDKARFVSGLAGEDAAKVARNEIDTILPLGKDTTRRLMDYGYSPTNLSDVVKAGKANGQTMEQIKQGLNNEMKLIDYLKTRHCGNSVDQVKIELKIAEDPRVAIKGRIHQDLWNEWKRSNPRSDELPTKMRSDKLAELSDKASEMTKRIERRLLRGNPTRLMIPMAGGAKTISDKKGEKSQKKDEEEKREKKSKSEERAKDLRRSKGDSRDRKWTTSKDTRKTGEQQHIDKQKTSQKKDERELKKAAEREKGGTQAPKESTKKEGGGGVAKETKKDAPASDKRTYPK